MQSTAQRTESQRLFSRAQKFLIEGVNSPSRGSAVYSPGPIVLDRASGSRVWDADGNEYVDFMMSFGALIHGHAHPALVEAVAKAMANGSHFAAANQAEVEAAEKFCRMVPNAEAVRFTNSGTEATMLALRLARAFTGRTKFLKFEGHYHGWYDAYLLNAHSHPADQLGPHESPNKIPDSAGIPDSTLADVILAPWNDVAALEKILDQHKGELAAVITEPIMANMGCIPPREGYLQLLRELTRHHKVLLIFDEVVTAFRYAPGGCQQLFGIAPDLSTFGKALGTGFPIGAVTGRREILEQMRWTSSGNSSSEKFVLHYGTFNGHRLTMEVVRASLDLLSANKNAAFAQIRDRGDAAIRGLREMFSRKKIPAIVQGLGPMFQIYFTERDAIHDYRDYCAFVDQPRYSHFVHALLARGIYMTPSNGLHWIISTAHTQADVARLLEAAEEAAACSA